MLCAQCQGPHLSLSMDCQVVKDYWQALKDEVVKAIKGDWLHPIKANKEASTTDGKAIDSPTFTQTDATHLAWGEVQRSSSEPQNQHGTKQLSDLVKQINYISDTICRMESKFDNQFLKWKFLMKDLQLIIKD